MDTNPTRASRGPREPAAQVKRLESQAVLVPKATGQANPNRMTTRHTIDVVKAVDEAASDGGSKKGSDAGSSSPGSSTASFEAMRAAVAEDRRREHRTPSTAPVPKIATLRKAHYLKSKSSRLTTIAPTRATMKSPSTWVSAGPRATSVRHKHTCLATPDEEMLIFYGGCTNAGTAPTQTLLTYNFTTRVWNTPLPRKRAGEVIEYSERRISRTSHASGGGQGDSDSENDKSEYVPMSPVSSHLENRFGHSAVSWGGIMWIFGGQTSTTGTSSLLTNSMLAVNIEKNEWWSLTVEGAQPAPRRGHSAVVFGDSMFVFGGCGANSEVYHDLWRFSLTSLTWTKMTSSGDVPSPRFFAASDNLERHLYVYGGTDGQKDLADFYVCNLETGKWTAMELSGETPIKPQAKSGARLVAFDSKLVLLGGSSPLDDYALDIYVYYTKKAAWYLQRYEMENDEPKNDGSSSPDAMGQRYSRADTLMTIDKRNRMFHSVALVGGMITTNQGGYAQCRLLVFGGVNQLLANVLDEISLEFSESVELNDTDDESMLNSLPPDLWEAAAMYYNPEVLALSERLRMLTGDVSYAREAENSGKTQAISTLGNEDVINLIMEWLNLNGYRQTMQRLVKDTRQPFVKLHDARGAALELLLSFARRRIKRGVSIWDDQVLSIAAANGAVQSIDHLPDWYHSQSKEIVAYQNPWDEAITDDNLRVDPESHRVLFATLNTLIILTLDYANFVNPSAPLEEIDDYLACFFHTYHSFTTPIVLMEKFIQLFEVSETSSLPEDAINDHRMQIIELLLVWIDLASWDWTNEFLTQKLKDFVDGPLVNTELRWMAPQIKQALSIALDFSNSPATGAASSSITTNIGKVKSQAITTKQLMSMNPLPGTQRLRQMIVGQLGDPPEPIVRKHIFSSHHTLDDVHELELARQLTIIQFSLFCMIKPSELLHGWWKSEDAEYRSPHVRVCMNRATIITDWVAHSIAKPGDDKKARGRAFERFFKVAEQLRLLNNLETLSAVLAGLRQAPEESLERVDKKALEDLYKLDTSISKHNELIDHLDVLTPCIPNLKLVLKQISKVEDEAELLVVPPSKLGRPLINMHKCRSLYGILRKLITLQARFYNLLPVYQIISPLRNPTSDNDASASASLRIMLSPRVQ
jgi:hypothetical protein